MKRFITFLLAMLSICFCAFSQSKPVVVIVPFDAKNVNKDEVDVISDVFLSEYTATKRATVVDRSSFDKIRAQQKFELSDWSDAGKVAQLGKALNAHQIVTGQISQFGSQLVCTIKLIDVNTTEVISSTVRRVANMDALYDVCSNLALEIAKQSVMNVKIYAIGDKGPGGGTVFAVEGDWRWEVSEVLTKDHNYYCKDYQSNGFQDWELPTMEQAKLIYYNLVQKGFIPAAGAIFTSTYDDALESLFSLKLGYRYSYIDDLDFKKDRCTRAVRKFNINDTAPKPDPIIGTYTAKSMKFDPSYPDLRTTDLTCDSSISIKPDGTFSLEFYTISLDLFESYDKHNKLIIGSRDIQNMKKQKQTVSGTWRRTRYKNDWFHPEAIGYRFSVRNSTFNFKNSTDLYEFMKFEWDDEYKRFRIFGGSYIHVFWKRPKEKKDFYSPCESTIDFEKK